MATILISQPCLSTPQTCLNANFGGEFRRAEPESLPCPGLNPTGIRIAQMKHRPEEPRRARFEEFPFDDYNQCLRRKYQNIPRAQTPVTAPIIQSTWGLF